METTDRKRTKSKRMRLPNGFGEISEIKGKRLRKPFRAMVTVGKTKEGKPIVKTLKPEGYFKTYNEAYAALIEYNKSPYDLEPSITIKELFDKWTSEVNVSRGIISVWRYCDSVKKLRAKEIRARHIKGVIDNGEYTDEKGVLHKPSPWTKKEIKLLFTQMLAYAIQFDIIDKNYAKDVLLDKEDIKEASITQKEHIAFTDDEMKILWNNTSVPYVKLIIIQIYTGFRPQELGLVEIKNCDLDNWLLVGGIKTEAGTMRHVPVHEKIRGFVKEEYDKSVSIGSKYLFSCCDSKRKSDTYLSYDKYQKRFLAIMEKLNISRNHRPHDPRKTFVTMAKKFEVDEYAIKRIVGHSITDITEKVYTERETEWLHKEIAKIK